MKSTKSKINIFSILFLLSSFTSVLAQERRFGKSISSPESNNPYRTISFGEKILFGDVESSASWTVLNTTDKTTVSLNGSQINNYVFKTPGIYELSFFENKTFNKNECSHPLFDSKMTINVSPVKMTYDFSNISFSLKINKGQRCDGLEITVPVKFELAESEKSITLSDFSVAGIGVDLIVTPVSKQIVVKNGVQYLKYVLSGIVNNETYLMFDFIDINNNVQTYNLPQIIN